MPRTATACAIRWRGRRDQAAAGAALDSGRIPATRRSRRIVVPAVDGLSEVGAGEEDRAGLVGDATDLDRLLDQTRLWIGQDGLVAQDLLDGGGQVGLVFAV